LAEKGTKVHSVLTVQDDDAATVKLTVGIINGAREGPILCITSGVYGTHYPGIGASIRLFKEIDPQKLKGTIVIVPVVEMTGFQHCQDISPIDGLNPNGYYGTLGLYPGTPNGTISHRIAYTVFNEIIKKTQYHLDLRGGDLWEKLEICAFSGEIGNKQFDRKTEELTKALGTPYYLVLPEIKGSLISETLRIGVHSAILGASKGLASFDEDDIQVCMKAIHNLLRQLKMLDGKPEIPDYQKQIELKIHNIYAEKGGLLYVNCKCGEIASKDQKLGEIITLKGEVLQELIAPVEGVIHYIFPKHVKNPGDLIIGIRRILK